MVQTTKKLQLTNPMIAEFLQELGEHTKKLRIERKNALRISLTVEELLLRWQEHCGKETFVTVTTKKRAGALSISISLQGEPWNPLFVEGDDTEYRTRLLDRLGLSLVYTYRRGTNYVTLRLTKQRDNSVVALLVAILAAMLIGIPCTLFAPSFASAVLTQVLIPVRTTMLNVLTAVAVPVVFLSVIQGIVGVGDIASFGKIGKRLMLRFVLKIVAFTGIATLIMIPVFSIDFLGEQSVTNFGDALQMFLDIFPETFVEPFANGNALQVIVISIVLGIAILVLDTRAEGIKDLFNQLNSALYIVMEWVSKLLPVMVFLLILETVWSENVSGLIHLWKPLLAVAAFCAFMILVELLTVAVKFKVSPFLLAKKLLSSNLIAFATSCAMASYSVATETCEKELGVAPKITKFGLPLGLVAYMPAISVYYLIILFYGLERYDISCSIGWLFIASITVALLSIATPPISGGSMACFAILLAQMAVPMETIAFALVMNVIAERFCTVANLSMLELELVLTAEKTGLLNREAMRQPRQRP